MDIIFRADASPFIGSGHIMRCLTLAKKARQKGHRILFICRFLPSSLKKKIEESGCAVELLKTMDSPRLTDGVDKAHAHWLGEDWETDVEETKELLRKRKKQYDWLIVDHYAIEARWEQRIRPHVSQIMVIDDLANRLHDCDLLLDQNFSDPKRYQEYVPPTSKLLLGPHYALLRPEFSACRTTIRRPPSSLKKLLVSYGGADPAKETLKCLEGLSLLKRPELEIMVVAGSMNPARDSVRALALACGAGYREQVDDMAQWMSWADIAFGAPGSTTWERFCLGLNAVLTAIVEDQAIMAEFLATQDLIVSMGTYSETQPTDYTETFLELEKQPYRWRTRCRKIMEIVDGRGTERVIAHLEGKSL